MRFLAASLLCILPAAAGAASADRPVARKGQPATGVIAPGSPNCPRATSYNAYRDGEPLKPRKLTELPPAQGYMAVYRNIDGCEAPLTVVEYRRNIRR